MKRKRHQLKQVIRKLRTSEQILNQGCGGFRPDLIPLAAAIWRDVDTVGRSLSATEAKRL